MTEESKDTLKLAQQIAILFYPVTGLVKAWVPAMVDPAMDNQPGLRNRILPIFAYGLFDAINNISDRLDATTRLAKRLGNDVALGYLQELRFIFDATAHALSCFTREECLFLKDLRTQFVHSDGQIHKNRSWFYITDMTTLCRSIVPEQEARDIIRQYFEMPGGHENALTFLRGKFIRQKSLLWVISALQIRWIEMIQDDICFRKTRRIRMDVGREGYKALALKEGPTMINLLKFREGLRKEPLIHDPVFADDILR